MAANVSANGLNRPYLKILLIFPRPFASTYNEDHAKLNPAPSCCAPSNTIHPPNKCAIPKPKQDTLVGLILITICLISAPPTTSLSFGPKNPLLIKSVARVQAGTGDSAQASCMLPISLLLLTCTQFQSRLISGLETLVLSCIQCKASL